MATTSESQRLKDENGKTNKQIENLKDEKIKLEKENKNTQEIKTKIDELQKQIEALKVSKANKKLLVASAHAEAPKVAPAPPVQVSGSGEEAMNWIISHEGGATSVNKSSLACGLAQSLPCSKILTYAGVKLANYNLNTYAGVQAAISTVPVETQRAWMRQYCINRYGSLINAKAFWQSHGWY